MASRKQNESEKAKRSGRSAAGRPSKALRFPVPLPTWADEIAQEAKLKPAPSKTKPKTDAKTDTKKPCPQAWQKGSRWHGLCAGKGSRRAKPDRRALDISLEKAEELERVTKERKKAQKKKGKK